MSVVETRYWSWLEMLHRTIRRQESYHAIFNWQ